MYDSQIQAVRPALLELPGFQEDNSGWGLLAWRARVGPERGLILQLQMHHAAPRLAVYTARIIEDEYYTAAVENFSAEDIQQARVVLSDYVVKIQSIMSVLSLPVRVIATGIFA